MNDREVHRRRGLRWTIVVLAALVALYALAGFVVVPRVARQQLIQYAERDLRAQIQIGAVRFNPFTLRAQLADFALSTHEGAPLVRLARLDVVAGLASLLHGVLTLKDVELGGPALEVAVAKDGTLNWARLASARPPPAPGAAGQPSRARSSIALRIEALHIRAGRIHFEDRSHGQPFSTLLDPIELDLLDFHSTPDFENRVHFSARTRSGEGLDWNGEFELQPFASAGSLQLSALKAATIAAYLQNALPFALPAGTLDAHLSYRWSSGTHASAALTLETLALRDLEIAPRGAATTPWIRLALLQLSGAQVDVASRRVQIGELLLQRPSLQVWREPSGALNLQQLQSTSGAMPDQAVTAAPGAQRAAMRPAPASAAASSASPPWTLALQRLKVEDGKLTLEDRSVTPAAKLRLSSIGLQLQGFSTAAPAQPLTLELGMTVGDGGQLHLQGDVTRAAPAAHLKLEVQRLDLTTLQPYLARQTDVALYRGNLSAQAQVSYGASASASASASRSTPQLDVSGSLSIADLAARERTSNSELVNWQGLELTGVHYQMQPNALHIEHINLRRAYGRVLIGADGTLNVAQALHLPHSGGATTPAVAAAAAAPTDTAASAPTAGTASSAAPMPIRIDHIDINGSAANFTDQSVQPNFSAEILSLRGSIVGLSSAPEARAQVHLSGQLDRYAPVSIEGELNPLASTIYTDLSLNFSNIDLTIFNPYSGKFAGYSIAQGKLATQMHYHVENRRLQATHHIEIDQLEFGPATENKPAVPLPIKLAAALLKDRHGLISIELPVSGTIDDPSFRLGPLIGRALLGLLTKAVTAPFSWLGSVFGGGGEQLAYVDFAAGSAQLREQDRAKVAQLAKALGERPQLKLDIPLHTVSAADDHALAQAALAQAAAAEQSKLSAAPARPVRHGHGAKASAPEPARSPQVLALEALYRAQFHADPQYPAEIDSGASSAAAPAAADSAAGAVETAMTGTPPAGTPAASASDPRASWLEQQLLEKYLPNGAQREALGRARADALQAAILAAGQLSPQRLFLTNRLSGGGSVGMSRMELQLQ